MCDDVKYGGFRVRNKQSGSSYAVSIKACSYLVDVEETNVDNLQLPKILEANEAYYMTLVIYTNDVCNIAVAQTQGGPPTAFSVFPCEGMTDGDSAQYLEVLHNTNGQVVPVGRERCKGNDPNTQYCTRSESISGPVSCDGPLPPKEFGTKVKDRCFHCTAHGDVHYRPFCARGQIPLPKKYNYQGSGGPFLLAKTNDIDGFEVQAFNCPARNKKQKPVSLTVAVAIKITVGERTYEVSWYKGLTKIDRQSAIPIGENMTNITGNRWCLTPEGIEEGKGQCNWTAGVVVPENVLMIMGPQINGNNSPFALVTVSRKDLPKDRSPVNYILRVFTDLPDETVDEQSGLCTISGEKNPPNNPEDQLIVEESTFLFPPEDLAQMKIDCCGEGEDCSAESPPPFDWENHWEDNCTCEFENGSAYMVNRSSANETCSKGSGENYEECMADICMMCATEAGDAVNEMEDDEEDFFMDPPLHSPPAPTPTPPAEDFPPPGPETVSSSTTTTTVTSTTTTVTSTTTTTTVTTTTTSTTTTTTVTSTTTTTTVTTTTTTTTTVTTTATTTTLTTTTVTMPTTVAPTPVPVPSPTPSPTDVPSPSPSQSPSPQQEGPSPSAQSPSPTPGTPTPTPPQPGAGGDPHCRNAKDELFDIHTTGWLGMVSVPRFGPERGEKLLVRAHVEPVTQQPCPPTVIVQVDVWGNWSKSGPLRFTPGGTGSPLVKRPPWAGGGLASQLHDVKRGPKGVVVVHAGPVRVRIRQRKGQKTGVVYFDLAAAGLKDLGVAAGGLLGMDSHATESRPQPGCAKHAKFSLGRRRRLGEEEEEEALESDSEGRLLSKVMAE